MIHVDPRHTPYRCLLSITGNPVLSLSATAPNRADQHHLSHLDSDCRALKPSPYQYLCVGHGLYRLIPPSLLQFRSRQIPLVRCPHLMARTFWPEAADRASTPHPQPLNPVARTDADAIQRTELVRNLEDHEEVEYERRPTMDFKINGDVHPGFLYNRNTSNSTYGTGPKNAYAQAEQLFAQGEPLGDRRRMGARRCKLQRRLEVV